VEGLTKLSVILSGAIIRAADYCGAKNPVNRGRKLLVSTTHGILHYVFLLLRNKKAPFRKTLKPLRSFLGITLMGSLLFPSISHEQVKYDFPQFGKETGQFFSLPAHWDAMDWGKFALLTGIAAVASGIELPARDIKFIDKALYYSPMAVGGRMYGELYTPFVLFSAYAAYSLLSKDPASAHLARKIGYEIGQSCLYAGAIVLVMKITIGRARPLANEGKFSFHLPQLFEDLHHSFPSGHTTEAFTMSTILFLNAHSTFLKVLACIPPFFTPFSRAYQGWHWISDVIFGGGLGYLVGKWIYDLHAKDEAIAAAASPTMAHPITTGMPTIYPFRLQIDF
jgi:membrane-associated phospholipid phosphatase